MPNTTRYFEAQQIWNWIQWRLPPSEWMEAQQVLHPGPPPVTDPILSAGLAEIQAPGTTRARRIELLGDLLLYIRNFGERN